MQLQNKTFIIILRAFQKSQKNTVLYLTKILKVDKKKRMSISENSAYYKHQKSDFLTLLDNGLKSPKSTCD